LRDELWSPGAVYNLDVSHAVLKMGNPHLFSRLKWGQFQKSQIKHDGQFQKSQIKHDFGHSLQAIWFLKCRICSLLASWNSLCTNYLFVQTTLELATGHEKKNTLSMSVFLACQQQTTSLVPIYIVVFII